MSKFNFYFIALASLILFSCNKSDDDVAVEVIRGYNEQNITDQSVIETFLKKHYIKEVVDNPGGIDDQDIKFAEIDDTATQFPIWDDPRLHSFTVEKHDIEYTIYYLQLREGVGEAPSRVDKVLTAYEGSYLYAETKKDTIDGQVLLGVPTTSTKMFETVVIPSTYFALYSTIQGFSEVFPRFKPGTPGLENPGNPASYLNFGAGVMFIPSGLAYFNYATPTIPSYSPLMFKFKFYSMQRDDRDADGILSINEDLNHNGDFTDDDTDNDGTPNYADTDDDGDGHLTKNEISRNTNGDLYDFELIPDCSGNNSDPNRIKRHLDYNCRLEKQ